MLVGGQAQRVIQPAIQALVRITHPEEDLVGDRGIEERQVGVLEDQPQVGPLLPLLPRRDANPAGDAYRRRLKKHAFAEAGGDVPPKGVCSAKNRHTLRTVTIIMSAEPRNASSAALLRETRGSYSKPPTLTASTRPPQHLRRGVGEGNHDDRLRRFLWHRAPELASLNAISIPTLLNLEDRRWSYVPHFDPVNQSGAPGFYRSGILVRHGIFARRWSGQSAQAHHQRFGGSAVQGHTHRTRVFKHRQSAEQRQQIWFEAGCQCSLEAAYMSSPDWQNGFVAGASGRTAGRSSPDSTSRSRKFTTAS